MDKQNVMHKTLIITMAAMFIVNLSVLDRIQEDVRDAMSELRSRNEVTQQDIGELADVVTTMGDGCAVEGDIDSVTDEGFTLIGQPIGRTRQLEHGTVEARRGIRTTARKTTEPKSTSTRTIESRSY